MATMDTSFHDSQLRVLNLCFSSCPRPSFTSTPTPRLLTELRMLENVTVTEAMAEDMEKLRPRLKKVHIRELVVAITIMPRTHVTTFTCRIKCCCGHAHSGQRLLVEPPRHNTTLRGGCLAPENLLKCPHGSGVGVDFASPLAGS